ncbi:ketopantoate reductase [Paraburkholderia sp. GAS334]
MLQDLEANRPMEIDPLLTVVQEMGRLVGEATPTINTVLALIELRERIAQQAPVQAASSSSEGAGRTERVPRAT